jgi:HlyD family secretion protein
MAGTPLLEIGDPGATEVVVDLLSEDAVRLRRGAKVEIVDWGGERPLTGTVRRIEPAAVTKVSALGVEEQRVNALIDVRDDAAVLGDGFRVEVRILAWEAPRVLLAPASAVFQEGSRWIAYVVDGGRARRRAIAVGHRGSAQVEVVKGLSPGDRVIVFPSDDVKDGVRVTPR